MDFRKTCYAICQDCIVQLGFFFVSRVNKLLKTTILDVWAFSEANDMWRKKKGWI